MAMKLSKSDMRRASSRLDALRARMKNMKKQGERATEQVIHTAEVSTAAFAMGFTQGRWGGVEIVGVPLELLLGSGLNLAGWMGLGGKHSSHLHGIGNGCLAAYMTTLGRGVGAAGGLPQQSVQGSLPGGAAYSIGAGGAQLLSDEELVYAAQAAAG